MPVSPPQQIQTASAEAIGRINSFAAETFRTRGGRIGSGMGLLLEGLWGYHTNACLREARAGFEIAWLGDHQYNDFAVVETDADWDPASQRGELLRIEAKSMIRAADESKAHFDAIEAEIGPNDLLLVLVWDWHAVGKWHFTPRIADSFIGSARALAAFRDALHRARGGTFVTSGACPDGCPISCKHVGEPLNASGKRERISGPESRRVSQKVSCAANFGGLTRMIGTGTAAARAELTRLRRESVLADEYVRFIGRSVK